MTFELPPPGPSRPDFTPIPVAADASPAPDLPSPAPETDTTAIDITRPPGQPLTGVLDQTVDLERPDVTRPAGQANERHEGGGDQHDAPAEQGAAEPVDAPTPASADGGDMPPPDVPPVTEGAPEPSEQGVALQRLFDYTAVADDEVHETIVDAVMSEPDTAEAATILAEHHEIPLGQAAEHIARLVGNGPEGSLSKTVEAHELEHGELLYSKAADSVGLRMVQGVDGIELHMTDPGAFADALHGMPQPNEEQHERFAGQVFDVLDNALATTSSTIVSGDPEGTAVMCGGHSTETLNLDEISGSLPQSIQRQHIAEGLPVRAADIAEDLGRLGAPAPCIEATSQLALAQQDGMVPQWAVGYDLSLIGHSDVPIGIDRMTSDGEWQAANAYLDHLAATAPGTAFTRNVFETVARDLDRTLEGEDPIEPYTTDHELAEDFRELRAATRGLSTDRLREAQIRLRQRIEQIGA
jgi:hypothetical protein